MLEEINRDVTISVDLSADGKRNAWTIHCGVVQHAKAYCVCIHLCKQRKEGRLPAQYSDCSAAIGKKECPALKMRKEEIMEGHAIYFRERVTGIALDALPTVTAFKPAAPRPQVIREHSEGIQPRSIPAYVPSKKSGGVLDQLDDTGYAKAISRAVEKEMPKVAPPPKVAPVAGESLLDMARRLMGK